MLSHPGFIRDGNDGSPQRGNRQAMARKPFRSKRSGTPDDVANAVIFLGSELSAYITGQVLNVDGGMLT